MLIQSTAKPTVLKAKAKPKTSSVSESPEKTTPDQFVSRPSEQALRISRYVEEKKMDGARGLKQMTALMAGQLTGMTLGSMIFAPLAFKFGNLYIATGGAALTGAAMAFAASKFSEKDFSALSQNKVADALGAGGAVLNSLPKFVYPTLAGATAAQKSIIYEALDRLPLNGVTSASTIDFVNGLEKAGASGLATPLFSQSRIFLDNNQMALGKSWAQEVTTHEIGHTFDFTKGVGPILSRNFRGGGFGKAPFISDYAQTNRMEDYAEAYAHYHLEPQRLKAVAPAKFEAIHASQQPGLVDQAMDRPAVRDAGRKIGSAFEAAPRVRNVLSLGASLVGPFQVFRGADAYLSGVEKKDAQQRIDGKMNIASGAALLGPGTAPLSLLLAAGHFTTNQQLQNGSITLEQAEKRADLALAVSTGPFGMVANSVQGELQKSGLLVEAPSEYSFNAFEAKQTKAGLGKTALGFAVGAVAGGLAAPFMHATSAHATVMSSATGTWVGGLAGAALGLGLHLLTAPDQPSFMTDSTKAELTKDDKVLLAKLATPAVVGGTTGAVGGYFGGEMLGRVIGQSVAGAAGGVTGAALGSYLGVLGGSYLMSKGGAKLGAHWAGLNSQK